MTIEEKAKHYDEAVNEIRNLRDMLLKEGVINKNGVIYDNFNRIFPELKENEDERIREFLIHEVTETSDKVMSYRNMNKKDVLAWLEKQDNKSVNIDIESMTEAYKQRVINQSNGIRNNPLVNMCVAAFKHGVENTLDELHLKQGEPSIKWNKNTEGNKPHVNHSVLMKTTYGIAEGEWKGEQWYQYRWAGIVRDSDVLSWMELSDLDKQGEQKSDDKVEPKFKVGEWCIDNEDGTIFQIVKVLGNTYTYKTNEGKEYSCTHYSLENDAKLWTIKDAKDGDVLICKGELKYSNGIKYERICLFNNLDNAFFTLTKTSNFVEEYDIDVNIDYPDNTVPATKEQKEILFMVMKDAGYEFDFEKKELKKIEQKSAKWSEKDDINLGKAIWYVENPAPMVVKDSMLVDWLKSIKDRYSWKPSDEQIGVIEAVINNRSFQRRHLDSLYEQLKKLREDRL